MRPFAHVRVSPSHIVQGGWSYALRAEVMDVALRSRTAATKSWPASAAACMPTISSWISAPIAICTGTAAARSSARLSGALGHDTPKLVAECGAEELYDSAMTTALSRRCAPSGARSHYLLPFGARSRFLFKMDFAEAEYISRLRSGVKGHFSYRQIAWEMKRHGIARARAGPPDRSHAAVGRGSAEAVRGPSLDDGRLYVRAVSIETVSIE